jgi:polyisoprenoid-binding protein YceI
VADDAGNPNPAPPAAAAVCYGLDPGHSRFTVQGFAGGMLSFLAHSPTFAVRGFAGDLRLEDGTLQHARIQISIRSDSLELLDKVKPADRQDIEGRIRREVLEIARYPEVRFESDEVAAERTADNEYRLRIHGRLTLHGVTHPVTLDAQLLAYSDAVRLIGETPLQLSDYRIRPVTALGGAIHLNDRLRVAFDLAAWKDGCGPERK